MIATAGLGAFIPTLTRDTRAEAFIRPDHPAVVYRDRVEEIFGLKDPIVLAVVNEGPHGVFNPDTLELVAWLTEEAMQIENVDPERVMSLATENDIFGTDYGMEVDPFYANPPETQDDADIVRENVLDFPLYVGSLAAKDGTATLVIAELLTTESGAGNYQAFLDLAERAPVRNGESIHVAGEGAVAEYLGAYIDRDAARLNPVSAVVITLVLLVAFRTFSGVILPNLVVVGAMAFTLGSMAAAGVPFYVITNSLPVIVLAVSVADGIHILSTYYEELAAHPDEDARLLTVRTMAHMWRPVTFTSLTDMAGFMGLSVASFMPPMRWFGVFASVGVIAALVFSLLTIPAAIVVLNPRQSGPFNRLGRGRRGAGDSFGRLMGVWGRAVTARPRWVLAATLTVAALGVVGASRVQVNEERMSVFRETEPIHIADREINARLSGTSYLDVVVEAEEQEGLFAPAYLRRIEAMQRHLESLPHVTTTTSIVDYLKQMNRAFNEDRKDHYVLPEDPELVAQYFLLYSATGDPTDLEEEIDYDYRLANIRAAMDSGQFQNLKPVVTSMQAYIRDTFNTDGLTAYLAGRVNVDYHWIKDLAPSHFRGVGLALIAVFLMASLSFRSFAAGGLASIPVCLALLAIYAVMGFFDIWLGIGTTMFAAIGIGVSVDFAIHTLDRLIALVRDDRRDLEDALAILYPSTGRALLFSFAAMALGFSVLLISEVPPLNRFGALVALAVSISFVTSMTVLPALVKLTRPQFLESGARRDSSTPDAADPRPAD